MRKYYVQGSYVQFFEAFIYANSKEEAEDIALSGDADYMMQDCNDWQIDKVERVKND